jgi:2-iminobutanoate/2-iminopropanoate deaminase
MLKTIQTSDAPAAVGPYSQAVLSNNLLFISGQIPLDPKTLTIASTEIRAQTIQVLKNLQAILHKAGATAQHVAKATVYLKNMNDYAVVNEEYAKFFNEHVPARVCIEVARLPKDVLVEIDAIACL